jgi:4-azaleucine resistance transporter AzlC
MSETGLSRLFEGVRQGIGPGAATFVFALTYGAAAVQAGWGVAAPLTFSVLAFSGSAQFVLLVTLGTGLLIPAVVAAVLVNVRYVVMSVALNDSLRGGRLRRALQAQALADASFAIAHKGGGRFDLAHLIGSTVPQWLGWVSGTAVGLVVAPSAEFMHDYGLDVAFPAFFLILAIEEMRRSSLAVVAGLLGAAIAAVALLVLPSGIALLLATLATGIGFMFPRAFKRADEEGDET